jgi:hypothetical protein
MKSSKKQAANSGGMFLRIVRLAHQTTRRHNPEECSLHTERRGSLKAVLLTYHTPHIQVDSTEQSKLSFQFHLVQHFCTFGWQRFCALPRKDLAALSGQFDLSVVEPNCHKEQLITTTGVGWRGSQPSTLLSLYIFENKSKLVKKNLTKRYSY